MEDHSFRPLILKETNVLSAFSGLVKHSGMSFRANDILPGIRTTHVLAVLLWIRESDGTYRSLIIHHTVLVILYVGYIYSSDSAKDSVLA